jgi:hypothetical protein
MARGEACEACEGARASSKDCAPSILAVTGRSASPDHSRHVSFHVGGASAECEGEYVSMVFIGTAR